jgi:hypothetical protein
VDRTVERVEKAAGTPVSPSPTQLKPFQSKNSDNSQSANIHPKTLAKPENDCINLKSMDYLPALKDRIDLKSSNLSEVLIPKPIAKSFESKKPDIIPITSP